MARNIRQAGALLRDIPGRGQRNPEATCPMRSQGRMGTEEREGKAVKGDASRGGSAEGEPERWRNPGEHASLTRRKKSGCE